eukprot:TRINITY_DN2494_c0_g1_i1.p1 TRINITY_DN2494_c0_g1~~TRINITY_DN2494_c0_g1_i1.p1  ORF type:complete len:256 (+),score=86.35 TRINITY_DN2494_c0_g1_i1:559-1326(+)
MRSIDSLAGASGSIGPACFSASTSEVGLRRRMVKRVDAATPVFSAEVRANTLMSRRPEAYVLPRFHMVDGGGVGGGSGAWEQEILAVPHNAIRQETMSLYTILGAMQRQWFTLTMGDIATFAEWWSVFELFLAQFWEVEDQVIFPWLTESAPSSRALHRYFKTTRYTKEKMLGQYHDVGATFELFNTRPPSEVLGKLYQALIAFLPALLSYLETQEEVLRPSFGSTARRSTGCSSTGPWPTTGCGRRSRATGLCC